MFALFALSVTLWQLMFLLSILMSFNSGISHLLFLAGVAISPLMSTFLFFFTQTYAQKKNAFFVLPIAILVGSLAYWSQSLGRVAISLEGIGIPKLDVQYFTIVLFHIVMLTLTIVVFGVNYMRTKSKYVREQSRIMLFGVAGAGFLGIMGSFSSSSFSSTILAQNVLPAASLIALASLFYAVTYKRLIDIRLAAVRSMAYVLSIATLAAMYFSLAYIASTVVLNDSSQNIYANMSPLNIIVALVLALIFQPIKHFFDKVTDRIFYRDRYDTSEFFERLSVALAGNFSMRTLLAHAASEIVDALKAEHVFFVVRNKDSKHLSVGTSKQRGVPLQDIAELDAYVESRGNDIIITSALDDSLALLRNILQSHQVAIAMPLVTDKTIIGYLLLGEQQGSGYTTRDIKVLQAINHELIIAIQNALSIQEIRDINANLKQRIDAATEELRASNARLRRIDATKDEFISMASHQLRTPLTSVKGYLSMVLDGDVGKTSAAQKKLLGEAFTSSERMVHLIHDFLNVSRLQTGKFMLEKGEYDLVRLVSDEVSALKRVAESRHLDLTFTTNAKQCVLNIDETKIRQVVMNFVDNALYYSLEGTTVAVTLKKTTDYIELLVADSGIGVPKAEQAQLFEKFYRASNARKHRPDGTGVGIFLAKKVITAHGGEIIFESREGKGSTFGFRLPLPKSKTPS